MFHHASPPYLELNTKPVSDSLNFPRGTDPLNHSIPYIPCDGFNLFQTVYFHIFSYIFPIFSQYFPYEHMIWLKTSTGQVQILSADGLRNADWLSSGSDPYCLVTARCLRDLGDPGCWDLRNHGPVDPGVSKCPFLGILNITFKYLLEFISPIVG